MLGAARHTSRSKFFYAIPFDGKSSTRRKYLCIKNAMIDTIQEQLPEMMLAIAFTIGEYLLVLCAVLADLISGMRKARRCGRARSSIALRWTVEKLASYYNALAELTIIDAMQIAAIVYLRITCACPDLPMLPVMTLLGSIGIAAIEVKSIYEKADEKEQRNFDNAAHIIARYLKTLKENGIKLPK